MASMKVWLERFFHQEARRATRLESLPLIAYNWDAPHPKSWAVRDVGFGGMYLLTTERWYPNTLIMMTMVRTDTTAADRSIQVMGRVTRSGEDGVGFEFVLPSAKRPHDPRRLYPTQADDTQLESFLASTATGMVSA